MNTASFIKKFKADNKNLNFYLIFFIIILGILVRVILLPTNAQFNGDQARDFKMAYEIFHNYFTPTAGPVTALPGVVIPPFYFYLNALFHKITFFNPLITQYSWTMFSYLAIMSFLIINKNFSPGKKLTLVFIFSFFPFSIDASENIWNPSYFFVFSTASFILFASFLENPKLHLALFSIASYIVATLIHYQGLVFLPFMIAIPTFVLLNIHKIVKRNITNLTLSAISSSLLTYLLYILLMKRFIEDFFLKGIPVFNFLEYFSNFSYNFTLIISNYFNYRVSSTPTYILSSVFIILSLFICTNLILKKHLNVSRNESNIVFLVTLFSLGLISISLYQGFLYPYYFYSFYIILTLITFEFYKNLIPNHKLLSKTVLILIFIPLINYFPYTFRQLKSQPLELLQSKAVANYLLAKDHPENIKIFMIESDGNYADWNHLPFYFWMEKISNRELLYYNPENTYEPIYEGKHLYLVSKVPKEAINKNSTFTNKIIKEIEKCKPLYSFYICPVKP